jgi:hypothetical protein
MDEIKKWTDAAMDEVRRILDWDPEESDWFAEALAQTDCLTSLFDRLERVEDLNSSLLAERDSAIAAVTAERDSAIAAVTAERDEARELAADLWKGLPTETKVEIFEKSEGWVPAWVRGRGAPRRNS